MNPRPSAVRVREVGPRDGLQSERPLPVSAGWGSSTPSSTPASTTSRRAAFVSPKAVPAMAGAAELVAALERRAGVTYTALVPNLRGAEQALAAGR